jgi:hypothetical protein
MNVMNVRIVRADRKDPHSWASRHVGAELNVVGLDDCKEPPVYVATDHGERVDIPVYCARVVSRSRETVLRNA